MTPLAPGALERLLKTLPPEKEDPFPHLENLRSDDFCANGQGLPT